MATSITPSTTAREPWSRPEARAPTGAERLAQGLGWLSVGLGLAQLGAPGAVADFIGLRDDRRNRRALRAVGARELTLGVGILTQARPARWLWGRLASDLVDLALLGSALDTKRANRARITAVTSAVAGLTLLDALAGQKLSSNHGATAEQARMERARPVLRTITIRRSPAEAYRFWHDFENLPRFMAHLESVQVLDATRSHWKARAPAGTSVEWDAEITEDRPNELIAWRSLPGARVPSSGTVRFVRAPGGQGTEVHVELRYAPPAGALGVAVAKLFGEEPGQQVEGDLRRFKQVMELGEVVSSDASIHAHRHPARPSPLKTPRAPRTPKLGATERRAVGSTFTARTGEHAKGGAR